MNFNYTCVCYYISFYQAWLVTYHYARCYVNQSQTLVQSLTSLYECMYIKKMKGFDHSYFQNKIRIVMLHTY